MILLPSALGRVLLGGRPHFILLKRQPLVLQCPPRRKPHYPSIFHASDPVQPLTLDGHLVRDVLCFMGNSISYKIRVGCGGVR